MITLVRCDERLIHGQTMQFVVNDFNIERIVVVDDMTASNPVLKSIFTNVAPKNLNVKVHTVKETLDLIEEVMNNNQKVLLLMKHPSTYLALKEAMPELPNELNIGAQMARGGTTFAEYATLSNDEIAACDKLTDMGVRVYFNAIGSSGQTVEYKASSK